MRSRSSPTTTRTRPSRSSSRTGRPRLRGRLAPRGGDDPDPEPSDDRGHPVHLHLVRAELRGLRRGRRHVRRAHGRRGGRGRRPHGGAHPRARRRVAATPAVVHPHLRRRAGERRVGRGLPDPRATRGRGVPERRPAPAGRHGRLLRRRGRDLRGQSDPRADRRDDHRGHQRGARPHPGAEPITIVANYWFSVVSSLVLAVAAYLVTERIIEPRLGAYTGTPERGVASRGRSTRRGRSCGACAGRCSRSSASSPSSCS